MAKKKDNWKIALGIIIVLVGGYFFGGYLGLFTIWSTGWSGTNTMTSCTLTGDNVVHCSSAQNSDDAGTVKEWVCRFTGDIKANSGIQRQLVTKVLSAKQGLVGVCTTCAPSGLYVTVENNSAAQAFVTSIGSITSTTYGVPSEAFDKSIRDACASKNCVTLSQDMYGIMPKYFSNAFCQVHINSNVGLITANGYLNGYVCNVNESSYSTTDYDALIAWDHQQGVAQNDPTKARYIGNVASADYQYGLIFVQVPTCSDGIKNGDELGVDCGGSCTACINGCVIGQQLCLTQNCNTTTGQWFGSCLNSSENNTNQSVPNNNQTNDTIPGGYDYKVSCTTGQVKTGLCSDGSKYIMATCSNGYFEYPTYDVNPCVAKNQSVIPINDTPPNPPNTPDNTNIFIMGLVFLAVIWFMFFLGKKGKKK